MSEETKVIKLDDFDKNRLAELILIWLEPIGKFSIKNDGTIVVNKHGPIKDWFLRTSESEDFLSLCHKLILKIMEEKGDIPYVSQLCGEAIGILVSYNDRKKVIANLYIASLTEQQPNFKQNPDRSRELGKKIEVFEERARTRRVTNVFVGNPRQNNDRLADLLNNSPHVVVVEEE